MPKPTTAVEVASIRFVIVTLDHHLASVIERASQTLTKEYPGLRLTMHAAGDWQLDPVAIERCRRDIAEADIIVATMLFMDEHIQPILPDLLARRDACDALIGCVAASEITRLTRLGKFRMDGSDRGALAFIKSLRGKRSGQGSAVSAADQMKALRRIPQILRFIPGTAQDMRAYFLVMQYWLAGSDENTVNMVRYLIERYADGPRRILRGRQVAAPPVDYPQVGVYHSLLQGRFGVSVDVLPKPPGNGGVVGLLLMRSYLLAGNTAHYDGVIAALEARGLRVIPVFSSGLDARPAITAFFRTDGRTTIDALVSLTGFSLVGGPAYNDASAAAKVLSELDVPYVAALPVEFQSMTQWQSSERGLLPIEATMMVAIPEIEGATGSLVFGGRRGDAGDSSKCMDVNLERADMLARRVNKLIALKRMIRAERKLGVVLFNFPPNGGAVGTAAFLSVFELLFNTLAALKREGYTVDLPADVDALRGRILDGNAGRYGAAANVHLHVSADEHVRREPHLAAIEVQWGPAPGRQQSDGRGIRILGERFGNVFVGIQPAFGYEGDPMRLLFEHGFAPTHAFSAFYRWIREDFGAHAVLHFGTHGALEFMPGKQVGLSASCWPDRLIADLPNFYLYAANNPSEGTLAKRRSAATLISYMTPPVVSAGLYRGLVELKASLDQWRQLSPNEQRSKSELAHLIHSQAVAVELAEAQPKWAGDEVERIADLTNAVVELEHTLIPYGLHVVGAPMPPTERQELISAIAAANAEGASLDDLAHIDALLAEDHELPAIVHALDGRFTPPAPGGDIVRTPSVLPTGRNVHGFDPFRIPSAFALLDGAAQSDRLLARHTDAGNGLPETVALVLWGSDNLKSGGGPIAQALALIGAAPRFDSYGRLAGATLLPLAQLGRPRIDVIVTLSGIFRDLLPLQIKLLAEASFLAASADEPEELNFVRKHALAYSAQRGCDLETAALRVFGNDEGAYGANVNLLVESSRWTDDEEMAETYARRKGFAYGRTGRPAAQRDLLDHILVDVGLTYQNLESVELGVTTVDTYFDTLGGISSAVKRVRGSAPPVYIGDQTRTSGTVRTLGEQVALETRTRVLNPKWYEAMLKHGYEGVRNIEAHVTNTMGWSATAGDVAPWVYQHITETFVLDEQMRERLARLNPVSSAKVANRLIEAHERRFWSPDAATLEALRRASDELEDRIEGIASADVEAAA